MVSAKGQLERQITVTQQMNGRVHVDNGIGWLNLHDQPLLAELIRLGRIRGPQGGTIVLLMLQIFDGYTPCQLTKGRMSDGQKACLVRYLNGNDAVSLSSFCLLCAIGFEGESLFCCRQVEQCLLFIDNNLRALP